MGSTAQDKAWSALRAQHAALDEMSPADLRVYARTAVQWLARHAESVEALSARVGVDADLTSPVAVELAQAFDRAGQASVWIEQAIGRLGRSRRV